MNNTKPSYNEDKDKFEDWASNYCKTKHTSRIKFLKEKAGKNFIKQWFYLGKNKIKKISELSDYEKDLLKDEIKKSKTDKIKCRSIIDYGQTKFDIFKWKSFKKWQRKVETKGIYIKRGWMDEPKLFRFYKDRHLFESPYKKFSSYWWKDTFIDNGISSFFKYNPKVCNFDFFDIFENLIVMLTIKGLFLSLHGNAMVHKEQAHNIWIAREKLLKAYLLEDYSSFLAKKAVLKEYGIPYEPMSFDKDLYLKTGKIEDNNGTEFTFTINPKLIEEYLYKEKGLMYCQYMLNNDVTAKLQRDVILKTAKEIDSFYMKKEAEYRQSQAINDGTKFAQDAFEFIAKNIYDWWD